MTDERRYTDEETREIFGLAANDQAHLPASRPAAAGLTLSELQAIGRDVGLDAARVADAAALVEHRAGGLRGQTYLGLPISVSRAVELDRPFSDTEWEVLVGELRETFGARGRIASQGGLREWVNGNLYVFQETTADGYRLRMETTKGTAVQATRMGVVLLGIAAVVLLAALITGQVTGDLYASVVLGGLGLAALGSNAIVLPGWARERESQMERLAARARELTAGDGEAR